VNFWQPGFWAATFWQPEFWQESIEQVDDPQGGAVGGGSAVAEVRHVAYAPPRKSRRDLEIAEAASALFENPQPAVFTPSPAQIAEEAIRFAQQSAGARIERESAAQLDQMAADAAASIRASETEAASRLREDNRRRAAILAALLMLD